MSCLQKKGHIARICKSGLQVLEDEEQDEDELEEPIDLMSIGSKKDGIFIPLTIEGRECELQLDTGASKTYGGKLLMRKLKKLSQHVLFAKA